MSTVPGRWSKLGRVLAPEPNREWMATYVGPSFAVPRPAEGRVDVYVTGRDTQNRSRIGLMCFDPEHPSSGAHVRDEPVFDLGELGAFDENGVSYPWIVEGDEQDFMYYVGWMPTVLTPFQNHIGLAVRSRGGVWRRYSRAPLLPRTDVEYLSLGSTAVLREGPVWRMWYTCFRRWGRAGEPKHKYVIKYAESSDGLNWRRPDVVCIDATSEDEYAIGRPSVIRHEGRYHMWYSYRGAAYRIGYASSADGISWTRRDDRAGINVSASGWDSESVCYSHVFQWKNRLYMLYCGNHYGRDGLGLAVLES